MSIFDSIKFKFTFWVFLIITVITVSLSVLSYEYEKRVIKERVYAQMNATVDLKKKLVVSYINERINNLKALARAKDLGESIAFPLKRKASIPAAERFVHIYQHLDAFKNTYSDYLSIEVADLKGNILVSTEDNPSASGHKHEHKRGIDKDVDLIKRGGTVVMQDYLDAEERHLDFAAGVRGKTGNIEAIIISSIALEDTLFPIFSDYTGLGFTGETLLVRRNGDAVVYINPARHAKGGKTEDADRRKERFKLEMNAASGNEGLDEAIDYRGERVIGAYRHMPITKWGIVAKMDVDEAFGGISALRKKILIFGMSILVLMLVVTYLVIERFTAPIIRLAQKTKAIASGDYSVSRIAAKRKDEIGDLERGFNGMVEALGNSKSEIENKHKELERANYELERKVLERTEELSEANTALTFSLEKAKKSEERFRMVLDSSVDAIVIADDQEKILFFNKAAEEIFGYKREELLGVKVEILIPEKYRDRHRKGFERHVSNGKGMLLGRITELEGLTKEGVEIPVELSLTGWESRGKRYLSAIVRDITERKKIEKEKKALELQLYQSQKMEAIGTLSGGIAHDFNNILTTIIGYGDILQMKMREDDPLRTYINHILASSEKAAQLTRSLLAYSRKQIISPKPINLNETIKQIEGLLLRLIGEYIEFETMLADEVLIVFADGSQIEQVLMNLCINARDAMPDGGRLIIETELVEFDDAYRKAHGYGKRGKYARISITDTGRGMDKRTRERIFEPFFTTKELGKGTGLGLSIVYGIIKQHNGYVNVYSEADRGTAFKIYLPIIESEVEEKEAPSAASSQIKGGSETLLVAEDDGEVRKFTKTLLERFGYKVKEAEDGEDAVMKFMENKDEVQLLILDVIMPKRNGKEAYEEIRKIRPDTKALFTSGYTADIINKKGILDEGLNFISKPFSTNDLLKKVREALDK